MNNLQNKAIEIKGQSYVMVKDRIIYFNENYPNGSIITTIEKWDNKQIVTKTVVTPDVSNPARIFTGYSQEIEGEGVINKTSALENSETSSCGRALAMMGIGIIDSIASVDEIHKATNRLIKNDAYKINDQAKKDSVKPRELTKEESQKAKEEAKEILRQVEEEKEKKKRMYLLLEEFKQTFNKVKDMADEKVKKWYGEIIALFENNGIAEIQLQACIEKIKTNFNQAFQPVTLQQTNDDDILPDFKADFLDEKKDEPPKGCL